MEHDPLCTFAPCECYKDGSGFHSCGTDGCQCDLIAKVRADERWKIIGVMEHNADGDAIKVIDAVLDML